MKKQLSADIRWTQGTTEARAVLSLQAGVTALVGPSGAGKTSLARILAGLDQPQSGQIKVLDDSLTDSRSGLHIPPHMRRIGYLSQGPSLFPHLSVRRNILFGCRPKWTGSLQGLTDRLGIETTRLDTLPGSLSGGEARRVALARAIAAGPEYLILDEPFTGLDPINVTRVRREILRLSSAGTPVLLISHSLDWLLPTASHCMVMNQGHIIDQGPTGEVLDQPPARHLFGGPNGGSLLIASHSHGHWTVGPHVTRFEGTPDTSAPALLLQIKSRDVALSQEPIRGTSIANQWPVTVTKLTSLDRDCMVSLALKDTDFILKSLITRHSADALCIQEGTQLTALVKASAVHAVEAQ